MCESIFKCDQKQSIVLMRDKTPISVWDNVWRQLESSPLAQLLSHVEMSELSQMESIDQMVDIRMGSNLLIEESSFVLATSVI